MLIARFWPRVSARSQSLDELTDCSKSTCCHPTAKCCVPRGFPSQRVILLPKVQVVHRRCASCERINGGDRTIRQIMHHRPAIALGIERRHATARGVVDLRCSESKSIDARHCLICCVVNRGGSLIQCVDTGDRLARSIVNRGRGIIQRINAGDQAIHGIIHRRVNRSRGIDRPNLAAQLVVTGMSRIAADTPGLTRAFQQRQRCLLCRLPSVAMELSDRRPTPMKATPPILVSALSGRCETLLGKINRDHTVTFGNTSDTGCWLKRRSPKNPHQ